MEEGIVVLATVGKESALVVSVCHEGRLGFEPVDEEEGVQLLSV